MQEQPRADDIDKEEKDDWEKMKVGLYFELTAEMLTKGL